MEFKIQKKTNQNISNYHKTDLDIAYAFTKRIYKEFGNFLRGVVLFGSKTKKTENSKSDIDILVILDDIQVVHTQEMLEAYKIITEKAVAETSTRLHVTTIKFTSFWDLVKNGDPVGINVLRDGVALIDTGFFDPLQILLNQGRINPSSEAIYTYFSRAPKTLLNSRWHILQAVVDLYWACIDSAHAALMQNGELPASPEHIADLMENTMVKKKLVDKKYVNIMRNMYTVMKKITYREVKDISGKQFDKYYEEAKDFVYTMRKFIDKN